MMNKISLSLLFAVISFHTQAQSPLIKEFLSKWSNSKTYTLTLLEKVPENLLDFKPTESEMTIREQFVHLADNMVWISGTYLNKDDSFHVDKEKKYTKAELVDLLTTCYQFSNSKVAALQALDLETKVDFFAGNLTKRQMLNLMDDHVTHHRAQLIVYLRLNNIAPPEYTGW